jgi:RNA polymerase sigma factor (sigma-70 family)
MNDMLRLIEPLIPPLRRYARALLRDRSAADDLVQDCLERAVSHWHQRRAEGDARTWMFTILHNLAINRFRQTAARGRHVAIDAVEDAALQRPPAQEEVLTYRDVMQKVGELPEEQRSVLLLIGVEDLSYAEAARVLDVPVGTVMSRLSRAREALRRAMERAEQLPPVEGLHLRRVK